MKLFFRSCLIGALVFLLSFLIFCPRFYLWDPLGSPDFPECNRGFYAFIQLHSPFIKIPDSGNEVMQWRLLMPVVGHLLHIHWILYFALPHLCALAAIIAAAYLAQKATNGKLWPGIAAAVLTGTSAMFFVSTGFLGYFDSALALAILAAAFARRNVTVWAAAALGPWIDERFIFALPIILWCQWRQEREEKNWKNFFKKFSVLILGVAPYLILRALSLWLGTDFSRLFFHHMATGFVHDPWRILQAVWDTLRWGWLAVIVAIVVTPGLKRLWALTVIPMSLTYLIFCAGDYTRSIAIVLPMMLAGIIELGQQKSRKALWLLMAAVALNLATPAYHSFRAFHFRIYPLATQLKIFNLIHK